LTLFSVLTGLVYRQHPLSARLATLPPIRVQGRMVESYHTKSKLPEEFKSLIDLIAWLDTSDTVSGRWTSLSYSSAAVRQENYSSNSDSATRAVTCPPDLSYWWTTGFSRSERKSRREGGAHTQ
jgi:hypothetical protein